MKGILYVCSVVAVLVTTVKADLVECPETGQSFYPHPNTCSQFIECNNGEYREVDCANGFLWNAILGFCDLPENAGCELDEGIIEVGSGNDIGDGNEDEDAGNGDGDNGQEEEGGDDEGGSGDDDTEVDGDDGEVDDGEGNGDNGGDSQEDNGDNEVDGEEGGSGEDNGNNEGDNEEDNGDNEVDGDEGNGDNEVDGEDGNGDNEGSGDEGNEGDGEGGNEDNEVDGGEDEDEGGSDEIPIPEVPEDGDDGQNNDDGTFACPSAGQHWFPHPLLCSQFIECHDGLYTVVDCIDGLHFNPSLGWCDFPENVGCVDSTTPPPTTTELPNIGGPVGECPALNGQYVDFLTDSKYCDVFYKCNWGTPIRYTCPPPLHFNPVLNVCDWAQDAGCTVG